MTPEPSRGISAKAWVTLIIALAIVAVDGYDLQCIGFLAPEIAKHWSLPLSNFGIVFGAGLAGTIPGAVLTGPAASRWGRRPVLCLAIMTMAIGTGGGALCTSIPSLAVLRLIGGMGMGAAYPIAMAIVADVAPRARRSIFTMTLLTGQSVGLIAGAALCSYLIPIFGWRSAFWLGGGMSLLLIPLSLIITRQDRSSDFERDPAVAAVPKQHILSRRYRPTTLLLWLAAVLCTIETLLIVNWLPGLLRSSGYTLNETLLASSVISGGGIAGTLALGFLIDRFGPFRAIPCAYVAGAVALVSLALFYQNHLLTLLISVAIGIFITGSGTSIGLLTLQLFPSHMRVTSAGTTLGIGRMSAACASLAVGYALTAGLDAKGMFFVAAAVALATAVDIVMIKQTGWVAPADGN